MEAIPLSWTEPAHDCDDGVQVLRERWDGPLVRLTILWLFTVVLLAPVTALTHVSAPDKGTGVVAIYIGVMVVSR